MIGLERRNKSSLNSAGRVFVDFFLSLFFLQDIRSGTLCFFNRVTIIFLYFLPLFPPIFWVTIFRRSISAFSFSTTRYFYWIFERNTFLTLHFFMQSQDLADVKFLFDVVEIFDQRIAATALSILFCSFPYPYFFLSFISKRNWSIGVASVFRPFQSTIN